MSILTASYQWADERGPSKPKPKSINLNVKPKPVRKPQKPLSTAEKRLIAAVEAVPFKQRADKFTDRQLTQYEQAKMRLGVGLKVSDAIKGEVKLGPKSGKIKRVPTPKPKPKTPDEKTVDQLTKT